MARHKEALIYVFLLQQKLEVERTILPVSAGILI
jgi:hypothetical protein